MNSLWKIDLDTLELFYKLIDNVEKDFGRGLNGNERELVFLQLMKEKSIKPTGHTELNKEELIKEYISKGKIVLNIDKEGYKIIKPKKKNK